MMMIIIIIIIIIIMDNNNNNKNGHNVVWLFWRVFIQVETLLSLASIKQPHHLIVGNLGSRRQQKIPARFLILTAALYQNLLELKLMSQQLLQKHWTVKMQYNGKMQSIQNITLWLKQYLGISTTIQRQESYWIKMGFKSETKWGWKGIQI